MEKTLQYALKFYKCALQNNLILSDKERININFKLSDAVGFDWFSRILEKYGYKIGKKINHNKYLLLTNDGSIVSNVILEGNHERIRIKEDKKRLSYPANQ